MEQRVLERTADLESANQALNPDIAERKQAEETLRASEVRHRRLFASRLSTQGFTLDNKEITGKGCIRIIEIFHGLRQAFAVVRRADARSIPEPRGNVQPAYLVVIVDRQEPG